LDGKTREFSELVVVGFRRTSPPYFVGSTPNRGPGDRSLGHESMMPTEIAPVCIVDDNGMVTVLIPTGF
jgi:hypothetical protein